MEAKSILINAESTVTPLTIDTISLAQEIKHKNLSTKSTVANASFASSPINALETVQQQPQIMDPFSGGIIDQTMAEKYHNANSLPSNEVPPEAEDISGISVPAALSSDAHIPVYTQMGYPKQLMASEIELSLSKALPLNKHDASICNEPCDLTSEELESFSPKVFARSSNIGELEISSSPPSSSPPQLFSSSPPASSQSSDQVDDFENISISKDVLRPMNGEEKPNQNIELPKAAQFGLICGIPGSDTLVDANPQPPLQTEPQHVAQEPLTHDSSHTISPVLDISTQCCEFAPQPLPRQPSPQPPNTGHHSEQLLQDHTALGHPPGPASSSMLALKSPRCDQHSPSQVEFTGLSSHQDSIGTASLDVPNSSPDQVDCNTFHYHPSGKRKASYESVDFDASQPNVLRGNNVAKPPLPSPKRSTAAALEWQHKKLSTPFRSPIIKRPKLDLQPSNASSEHSHLLASASQTKETVIKPPPPSSIILDKVDVKKKYRTQRASGQFKSPITASVASGLVSSVRMTPTIQTMECKLQNLKRAVKVKQNGDEETLQRLVKIWAQAGREVALEVWSLVKENAISGDQSWGQVKNSLRKGQSENSWGMDDGGERNWGWNATPTGTADEDTGDRTYEIDDEEGREDTLGTMLMQLGIAPETLGWNEEEGVFQE